jgi:tRNA threonylcarbamoyladenosine modification (KEOPS) complex Cgi121 subunit
LWVSGIKGSGWFVAIGGFRVASVGDPRGLVRAVGEAASPQLAQIVDAGRVAGRDHLYMATVNAARSTETGLAVSKSITVEALLYASAQDQITKALARMGVNAATRKVALMVFAHGREEAEEAYYRAAKLLDTGDDGVLEIDAEKARTLREAYNIGDKELEAAGGPGALGGLIVERGSLLSLRR